MSQRVHAVTLTLLAAACVPAAPPAQPPEAQASAPVVAFAHTTVVPMDSERVLRDYTVVVDHGVISAMGPASAVRVPRGAVRIDGTGRYLMPALSDMHVHLLDHAWSALLSPRARAASTDLPFESFVFPYVANGVTLVQELSATPEDVPLREQIRSGAVVGPRLILAKMIDGPGKAWPPPISAWVATPAEARAAVRQARSDGYDKIKVYSFLSRESYDAIVDEADSLRMDVIGHVPMALSVEDVLAHHQKLIAHSEELLKHTDGDLSPSHIDYYAALLADHGTYMTSTLVTTEGIISVFKDPEQLLSRPEAKYFGHPMEQGAWLFMVERLYKPVPAAGRQWIEDGYERFQRPFTRAFHDHGGKLMTGTDSPLPGLVPGFALHRELEAYVSVGLTPYEALRSSTTVPYEFLGESERMGTIAVGMHSDMILLDANPLENVSNAQRIAGVLMRGRWIGSDEIRSRMQEIAKMKPIVGDTAPSR
jgi:hypothetical protein